MKNDEVEQNNITGEHFPKRMMMQKKDVGTHRTLYANERVKLGNV